MLINRVLITSMAGGKLTQSGRTSASREGVLNRKRGRWTHRHNVWSIIKDGSSLPGILHAMSTFLLIKTSAGCKTSGTCHIQKCTQQRLFKENNGLLFLQLVTSFEDEISNSGALHNIYTEELTRSWDVLCTRLNNLQIIHLFTLKTHIRF